MAVTQQGEGVFRHLHVGKLVSPFRVGTLFPSRRHLDGEGVFPRLLHLLRRGEGEEDVEGAGGVVQLCSTYLSDELEAGVWRRRDEIVIPPVGTRGLFGGVVRQPCQDRLDVRDLVDRQGKGETLRRAAVCPCEGVDLLEALVAVVDECPVRLVEVDHLLFVAEEHAPMVVVPVQFLVGDALPCVRCTVVGGNRDVEQERLLVGVVRQQGEEVPLARAECCRGKADGLVIIEDVADKMLLAPLAAVGDGLRVSDVRVVLALIGLSGEDVGYLIVIPGDDDLGRVRVLEMVRSGHFLFLMLYNYILK